jgi:hypothetical protein
MSSTVDHMLETSLLCRQGPKPEFTCSSYRMTSVACNLHPLCFYRNSWSFLLVLHPSRRPWRWVSKCITTWRSFFNHTFHFLAGSFAKPKSVHISCSVQSVIKKKYGQDATNVGDEGGFAPNIQVCP